MSSGIHGSHDILPRRIFSFTRTKMRFTTVILAIGLMASTAIAGNCGAGNVGYCMSGATCRMEGGHIIQGSCPISGAGACCAW
ncbi:hypothetical protein BKA57DRAFT_116509 [Linnemannia elongata]|nr:hypothetical protein BKA57DRAFT_116509 [Linnemannia elongata]